MRVCIVTDGVVENVVNLPDGFAVDAGGAVARKAAAYAQGADSVPYEAVYAAPAGGVLIADAAADRGWAWSVEAGFTAPPAPPAAAPVLPPRAFLNMFTSAEQLALVQASMTNAAIKLWYDRAIVSLAVDLGDPAQIEGVNALVPAGVLTSDRAAAILAGDQPA